MELDGIPVNKRQNYDHGFLEENCQQKDVGFVQIQERSFLSKYVNCFRCCLFKPNLEYNRIHLPPQYGYIRNGPDKCIFGQLQF
jgi:hypothetical protein